jgi:hypothetical protein
MRLPKLFMQCFRTDMYAAIHREGRKQRVDHTPRQVCTFYLLAMLKSARNLKRYRIFGLHEFVDPLRDCFSAKIMRDFGPTAALRFDATSTCIWNS